MRKPFNPETHLKTALDQRADKGILRKLTHEVNGVDFFSNDYLGFAKYHSFAAVGGNAVAGSASSRLIAGNHPNFETLEHEAASRHGVESALFFNSGYAANLGLLSSLNDRHTAFVYDEYCHASLIDGMRLGPASRYKYRHNDMDDLKSVIARMEAEKVYVVTESVFSMDGDSPDIQQLLAITQEAGIPLIVDEAHAIGVLGDKGLGLFNQQPVFARVVTYGKAFGLRGAAVLGSETLKQYLVNFARTFVYTTAESPELPLQIVAAYQQVANTPLRNVLNSRIQLFRDLLDELEMKKQFINSSTAIQCLMLTHGNEEGKALSDDLRNEGFLTKAIYSPTVPEGKERIRISLHSFNTEEEIRDLLSHIKLFYL